MNSGNSDNSDFSMRVVYCQCAEVLELIIRRQMKERSRKVDCS